VPREVRELEMLDAAADAFARLGYNAASMEEIARAAGISKPMLYSYFGSKEGLFQACARRVGEQLREAVRAASAAAELPPDERLWHGLLAVFGFIDEHREMWTMFHPPAGAEVPATMQAGAVEGREAMSELLSELLSGAAVSEGIGPEAAAEAAPIAYGFTATVIGIAGWWMEHPEEPKELQALRVMNLTWTGLGDVLGGRLWLPPE
jgi:AcrR family transcriptional regulator